MGIGGKRIGIVAAGLGAWIFTTAAQAAGAFAMTKPPMAGGGSTADHRVQSVAVHGPAFGLSTWEAFLVGLFIIGLGVAIAAIQLRARHTGRIA